MKTSKQTIQTALFKA